VVAGGALGFAFWWVTQQRIVERLALFDRQLVDALELCARALRSGQPLSGCFHLLSREIPAPVGTIFTEICQQQAMGASLDESLRRATEMTRSADMKLFSAALSIHSRTGGNLAGVMQSLATVIRERMRLNRRFRVITAQTQFSKRVLLAMPILVFAALASISPAYVRPLYDTGTGRLLLTFAAALLLAGWFMMEKMSSKRA
jgi:tight adherence protein B